MRRVQLSSVRDELHAPRPVLIDPSRSRLCQGVTTGSGFFVASDVFRHIGCPKPPLLTPLSSMSKTILSGRVASPETPRLPGPWAPRVAPENATAHTMPSRSTRVAHIWLFRPLVSVLTAVLSAALRAA